MTERKKRGEAKEPRAKKPRAEKQRAESAESHDSDDDVRGGRTEDGNFEGAADAFDRERLRLGLPTDAALAALLEVGPEAVEHLLKAAQELLLAAKAVVDAGERAVESHREATGAARTGDGPERDQRVRRIDLA